MMIDDTIDLIKRKDSEIDILIRKKETLRDEIAEQQAEVERLNKEVDRLSQVVMYHDGQIADAIKEFAERLEKEIIFWQDDIHTNEYDCHKYDFVFERIYEIIKEMVGD